MSDDAGSQGGGAGKPPRKRRKDARPPAPPPPPSAQATAAGSADEVFAIRFAPPEREYVARLLPQRPTWTKSDWLRYFVAHHAHLERVVAPIAEAIEAYALNTHMTVPAHRRKPDDWDWMLDILAMFATERVQEMRQQRDPLLRPLPSKPPGAP